MWFYIESSIIKNMCNKCKKRLQGKNKEYYFRVIQRRSSLRLCSTCLRDIANQIDKKNEELENK